MSIRSAGVVFLSVALAVGTSGCSDPSTGGEERDGAGASGGATRSGGATGAGGRVGTGGTTGSGGAGGTGGATGAGGAGGETGSGGKLGSGGTTGSGGATGSGGKLGSGGTTGSGGATGTGGRTGAGGATGMGGTTRTAGTTGRGGATGTGGATGAGGRTGAGGATGRGGATGAGGSTATGLAKFSFFVTSIAAMRRLSGNQDGFGGDLRYGQANGLAGADKICSEIAESSMPGSSAKGWRAFLSTSTANAIDRVGTGPWYDRLGRLVANTPADLQSSRPVGADAAIINDLPNETGTPNHNPDGTGQVDNHDTLTGSDMQGKYYGSASSTCTDWTSLSGGSPRVGHCWPGGPSKNWSDAMSAPGCAATVNLSSTGNTGTGVGSAGGYGGIYCFALTP